MSASVGSTDHPQLASCSPPDVSFYSLFSVSNPPQPGIRVNIRWTRRRLAAICAALILPTFFFLRFSKAFLTPYLAALLMAADARALPAIKSRGMIPPRYFRRRVRRRGPQGMMTCLTEDTPLVFYTIFYMMEQLNDSPAYFFRLPEATSRRRFSPILMARLV